MWKQGRATKDWFAEYKGISIRVRVDPDNGHPTEICWYLNGKLAESEPVTSTLEVSKQIAFKVVDRFMSLTVRHLNEPEFLDAEKIRGWRHNNEVPPAKALRAFVLTH
jgi:hypothetical protein